MEASSWYHKLSHFYLPYWIWEVWKERDKIAKSFNISSKKIAFEMNWKEFSSFGEAIICGYIYIYYIINDKKYWINALVKLVVFLKRPNDSW